MKKQLWMLIGGNGAGKTTFYKTRLEPKGLPFINADIIAKEMFPDDPEGKSYEASEIAKKRRYQLLKEGRSFCFETVFSHPSKIDFIAEAKAHGYEINLVFIHLEDSSLNKARVSQRVTEGGHHVPDEKVEARIPRTLDNAAKAYKLCDNVLVLDNSSHDNPFKPMLIKKGSSTTQYSSAKWLRFLAEQLRVV